MKLLARLPTMVILAVAVIFFAMLSKAGRRDGREAERREWAEKTGVRVARIARDRRVEAERAERAYHAAKRPLVRAQVASDSGVARFGRFADSVLAATPPGEPFNAAATVLPPYIPPLDTVVTLGHARAAVQMVADTARSVIQHFLDERAQVRAVLGNADTALGRMKIALLAQDSLVMVRDSTIKILEDRRPRWSERAVTGVSSAAAGSVCGAAGWFFGGPLVGVGTGVLCAAVTGIVRR